MAKQLFANNVSVTINEFLSATDTTITVSSTSRFPTISGGDWIMATIVPVGGQGTPEVVKITNISGNDLTVVRGQEGSSAQSFTYGALLELRVTKGSLEWLRDQATIFVDAITTVNTTSMVDGTVLHAKGRSSAGDGGGGVFRYVAGSVQAADGGTVFLPAAGGGRLLRDLESKEIDIEQFGDTFDSGFSSALESARSSGGEIYVTPNSYAPSTRPEIVGEFTNGLVVHGDRAVITSASTTQDGVLIGNKVGSIASSYFNKFKISDLVFVGQGKTGTAAGVRQQAGADIQLQNIRVRNFNIGFSLDGGLTSDFSGINVRDNGVGIKADIFDDGPGGLNTFAPNANTFYGARVFYNDVAVKYLYNPSGCANWIGSNFEANNQAGNTTDGVKVIELENAGHHNFFGTHHESNLGQYGIYFNGFDNSKNLLMVGCEVIDAVGTNLHMQRGRLTSVGSRITNTSSTNDIFLNTGARATLIDTEGTISGDLSAIACLRDGRIGFGIQPVIGSPVIDAQSDSIAASSNIAANFRNDTVQIRFQNTAGTRVGYLQTSAAGDHILNNDNAAGGWSIRANNTNRFYAGRAGAASVEPGADNTHTCGSASLRWSVVYAGTGTINTSDERTKQDISELDDAERRVAQRLKSLVKKFRFKDAVASKGDTARIHVGVIAQEVGAAFAAEGLDPDRYAVFCKDEWNDQFEDEYKEVMTDNGIVSMPTGNRRLVVAAGQRLGVRYDQLFSFILASL